VASRDEILNLLEAQRNQEARDSAVRRRALTIAGAAERYEMDRRIPKGSLTPFLSEAEMILYGSVEQVSLERIDPHEIADCAWRLYSELIPHLDA